MEESTGIDVTLSIVNTNNGALLKRFLDSIENSVKRVRYEIIVVDNASNDGSAEMLAAGYPAVKVIRNASREGYGACHNRAIETAAGEYVLILNEDMEMVNDAVDRMVEKAREIDGLGVMGCRLLNPDGSLQHSCFRFRNLVQELFEAVFPYNIMFKESRLRSKMYDWNHDTQRDVDIVLGCCMLIPSRVIAAVGVFDPGFFVYSEEDDFCRRVRDKGLRVVFTPDAEIVHLGGQTSRHMSLKMHRVQLRSKTRYFHKHHGTVAAAAFRGIVGLGAVIRLAGWGGLYLLRGGGDSEGGLRESWASFKFALNANG
jgi:GT2 family glycosyltransferase